MGRVGFLQLTADFIKPQPQPHREADGGGRLIGIFERLAVVMALVTSQTSLLAVIVAIKGLARYPDIESGHLAAEKFIVGTFASLIWAGCCALIALNVR
ncbi:hypothetical protein [Rothia sp. ZJ1223]|uniref:hypothetical protein n=1 Tax=Rothia sp. ZJ1223 TaxID=2811098 RepID=UPI00195E6088|nr:hypothetical protein [Rothia sp. ZJ1223]MBM7050625.1 hypothetical protein [Rothia sp. ZJ1223]